ncbi:hypothetical protein P8936_16535 [Edaphobacter paludis]|uniref:Uncharacterized protein n=1 Tax=Edaphobacter paludis TaxID=3035702 RepID=A0AAU7D6G4_9BACT
MASIPLPALDVKTPQQPDLLSKFGQLQQLRNASMQTQMAQQEAPLRMQQLQQGVQAGGLQVQQQQQDLAARQALNAAYSGAVTKDASGNPTIDANKLAQGLANTPAAYQTPQVMKGITDFQKSRLELQTTATDLQSKQADMIGSAAAAIKAANYDPTLAHSLLDSLPQSPQLAQIRQQIDNPQALKQIVDSAIQNSPKQRTLGAAEQTAGARQLTAQTEKQKLDASMNPQSSLYAPSQASVALGTAPGAAQIQAGEARQAAQKAGAEENARMPGEMALARQRQALSQGDPNAAAQLLVSHDATLSELKARGATPDFIAKTLNAAHQISGGQYNAQQADAEFQVAKSPANVAFFGSAKSLTDPGGTLDQLATVAKSLPSNQIPAFNSLADWEKAATGNGPLAHYASTALGVADDYAKVMGGGQGSDTSRLQALNLIKSNASPEARANAIDGIRGAVVSQTKSRIGNNPVLGRMYGDTAQAAQGGMVTVQIPGSPAGQIPASALAKFKADHPNAQVQQ